MVTSIIPDVPSNFISFYSGVSQAAFRDFSVMDSTITNNCHFFSIATTGGLGLIPEISVINATFHNIYEAVNPNTATQKTGVALMFDISGTLALLMDTLTIENVLFSRNLLFMPLSNYEFRCCIYG